MARTQAVKAAFFPKFWLTSGKEAVQALAAAQLEVRVKLLVWRVFACFGKLTCVSYRSQL